MHKPETNVWGFWKLSVQYIVCNEPLIWRFVYLFRTREYDCKGLIRNRLVIGNKGLAGHDPD